MIESEIIPPPYMLGKTYTIVPLQYLQRNIFSFLLATSTDPGSQQIISFASTYEHAFLS